MSKPTANKVQKRYIGAVNSGQGMSPLLLDLRSNSRPQVTPAARGLEELFLAVLERFLKPIYDLRVYCKN